MKFDTISCLSVDDLYKITGFCYHSVTQSFAKAILLVESYLLQIMKSGVSAKKLSISVDH